LEDDSPLVFTVKGTPYEWQTRLNYFPSEAWVEMQVERVTLPMLVITSKPKELIVEGRIESGPRRGFLGRTSHKEAFSICVDFKASENGDFYHFCKLVRPSQFKFLLLIVMIDQYLVKLRKSPSTDPIENFLWQGFERALLVKLGRPTKGVLNRPPDLSASG
jgi:hypothetical protein